MALKKRGCLVLLAVAAFLAVAIAVAVSFLVPGDLSFRGRTAPALVVQDGATLTPAPAGSGRESSAGPATAPQPAAGWVTYLIPTDILQAELRKAFPIRQNVVDLVRLQLDRPTFLTDPSPDFLRIQLEVETRVIEGNQSLPGTAIVRTQLGYDRVARKVTLRNAQLVDLRFTGDGASLGAALQPVLSAALGAEMEGYPIFEVPADGLWWLKAGVSWIRDVYVQNGRVAVALGP